MDEARLRQQVCQAAYQLWARGLVPGDGGLVSVELHRRRFLATPHHARRPNLTPDEVVTIDMGGLNIADGPGVPENLWRTHRAAYKLGLGGEFDALPGRRRTIAAAILAEPPLVLALMQSLAGRDRIDFGSLSVPLIDQGDDRQVAEALRDSAGVAIRGLGLLAAAESLATCLNWIERVDQTTRIAFAVGAPASERPAPGADGAEPSVEQETDPEPAQAQE